MDLMIWLHYDNVVALFLQFVYVPICLPVLNPIINCQQQLNDAWKERNKQTFKSHSIMTKLAQL